VAAVVAWPDPGPRVAAVGRARYPEPRVAAVGAWPVHWFPCGCRGGVPAFLVGVWLPWRRGRFPGALWPPLGRGRSRGPLLDAVSALPVYWSPSCRQGGVAGPLINVSPPSGVTGPLAAVGVRPVSWSPSCRRGGVACPLSPSDRRGGVAGPLLLVWPPWGRGRTPGTRLASVGARPSPGACVAAVRARPVNWLQSDRRGGVACPLVPVCPAWGRGRIPATHVATVGRARYPDPRVAAVGAWPVHWFRVATVGSGRSPGPRMDAVGAWPVIWSLSGCCGVVNPLIAVGALPVPWSMSCCRGGVANPLVPVWLPMGRCRSPGPCLATVGAGWSPASCLAAVVALPVGW